MPVKIVADVDAIFDGYHHLGAPEALQDVRSVALANIDSRIAELGILAEPSARKIKDKVHSASFKARYGNAKEILRRIQQGEAINEETIAIFDSLFTWEQDVARVKVCHEDDQARKCLVPLLDGLRAAGICVLSRGAIEDYYPVGAQHEQKPQRALLAVDLINTKQDLAEISTPLADGRCCELSEIFTELFRPHEPYRGENP